MPKVFDRDEQAHDETVFAQRLEHFRRRWVPEDQGGYVAREFETELYQLISSAQRVACLPLVRQMSAALAAAPSPLSFIPDGHASTVGDRKPSGGSDGP
jgi:hypothetical protein